MNVSKENIIIQRLKDGIPSAYRELFNLYWPLMCAVAFTYTKDKAESEIIADDIIFRIWKNRHDFSISLSLKAYLIKAAKNGALDYCRKKKQSFSNDEICHLDNSKDYLFVDEDYILQQLAVSDIMDKLEVAVNRMPPECRKVFTLSRFKNLSYEEIANETGLSVNTVKYHIKNALSRLRRELRDFITIFI